jgi:restriction endonuclease Mrr
MSFLKYVATRRSVPNIGSYRRREQIHRDACVLYQNVMRQINDERARERARAAAAESERLQREATEQRARKEWQEMHRDIAFELLDALSGEDFERALHRMFLQLGFNVKLTKGIGDQGADLLLERDGTRIAVQAKRYKCSVGNAAVQEVLGAVAYYDCKYGIVATTAGFTRSARELAQKVAHVQLWDRSKLEEAYLQAFPQTVPPFSWERFNELKRRKKKPDWFDAFA